MNEEANRIEFRLAVVETLIAAADRRHEIVDLFYDAPDPLAARDAVASLLDIDENLAVHVLDMPLRRMSQRGRAGLESERLELRRSLGH